MPNEQPALSIDELVDKIDRDFAPEPDGLVNQAPQPAAPAEVTPADTGAPEPPKEILDELEDDEALFMGGPTKKDVQLWKEQYPHAQIRATLLADGSGLIWRTLNRLEWKGVQHLVRATEDPDLREEVIFSKVVLFPDCKNTTVIGTLPAGALTAVMNEFYTFCGFSPVAESIRL